MNGKLFDKKICPYGYLSVSNETLTPKGSIPFNVFAQLVGFSNTELSRLFDITNCSIFSNHDFISHFGCGYCGRYSERRKCWIGMDFRYDSNIFLEDNSTIQIRIQNLVKELQNSKII